MSVSESQDIEREKCGNELKEVGGSRDMDSSGLASSVIKLRNSPPLVLVCG